MTNMWTCTVCVFCRLLVLLFVTWREWIAVSLLVSDYCKCVHRGC